MENNRISYSLWAIMVALFLNGCGDQTGIKDEALSLLETEVFYHQSIVLPKGAILEVYLQDISKVGKPAVILSHASRVIKNNPPFVLQLAFPQHVIKNNHHYDIQASIKVQGRLYFMSTVAVNPFEVGVASPIKIIVEHIDQKDVE
tara:strand:+ start:4058 stop:4495 length:438 start_codon:yes stop_codon:yes gene_type:complete